MWLFVIGFLFGLWSGVGLFKFPDIPIRNRGMREFLGIGFLSGPIVWGSILAGFLLVTWETRVLPEWKRWREETGA